MKKFGKFLLGMLKIGCIGFGGGSALIPLIEREFVGEGKLEKKENYDKDILVASLTPGALPVELASSLGWRNFGVKGMLLGAVCMALPGALATILLLTVLQPLREKVGILMELLTIAISIFIIYLIIHYIRKVLKRSKAFSKKFYPRAILVMVGVFVLSCGKNLYRLFGLERKPLFAFSTFGILVVAFIAILCINLVRELYRKKKFGKKQKIALALDKRTVAKNIGLTLVAWALFLTLLTLPAIAVCFSGYTFAELFTFVGRGTLSVVMSFGGGDAYLAVADGLFVETQMVSSDDFYIDIVSVANILPGSILGKALTGIGYYFGMEVTGSVLGGLMFALAGFAVSITLSGLVVEILYHLYDGLANFRSVQTISHYIGPIISGLLATIILALLIQCKSAILVLAAYF